VHVPFKSSFFSVPVSRLPDLISAAKQDFEELGLVAPIAGHVGDGEPLLHMCFVYSWVLPR